MEPGCWTLGPILSSGGGAVHAWLSPGNAESLRAPPARLSSSGPFGVPKAPPLSCPRHTQIYTEILDTHTHRDTRAVTQTDTRRDG